MLVSPPEEAQKQKELSKAEMQEVLREKAQLTADLHSMEKSFSDLFKRFEKQKVVIEGYRKVGAASLGAGTVAVGALQEEGLSPALVWSLARREKAGPQVGPGSALPLPTPWALSLLPATGHGCLRGVRVGLHGDCRSVLAAVLFPTPTAGAAGYLAPRARGWGTGQAVPWAWCLHPFPPRCLDGTPWRGPEGHSGSWMGVRGAWAVCRETGRLLPRGLGHGCSTNPPRELGLRSGLSVHLPPRMKSR